MMDETTIADVMAENDRLRAHNDHAVAAAIEAELEKDLAENRRAELAKAVRSILGSPSVRMAIGDGVFERLQELSKERT